MNRKHHFVIAIMPVLAMSIPDLAADRKDLLEQLISVERQHAALCPASQEVSDLSMTFLRLEGQLRSGENIHQAPLERIEALNNLLFLHLGINGSADLKDPCNILPSRILERRKGYCVGIAAIYLALSERLGLPIHAVATPSHVFLRYDDGVTRINIETLQKGTNVPDEAYIREQKIPEASIRKGVFMRNLSMEEFLAQFHNNIGVIYSERKSYERAAREYEEALDLDPRLPAAHYNYGTDLLRLDRFRPAARYLSKSLRLYPTDVWALNNRGRAYFKIEKIEKARRDFEEALRIDPSFDQARRNLESIQSHRSAR